MAIICADTWMDWRGTAVTGDDLTSAAAICAAVDRAIREAVFPFVPDPVTVTSHVMDAPVGNALLLPLTPARSITSIYLRWGADGDPALFTSDYLLTAYTDYVLHLDRPDLGYSKSGIVRRRGSSSWGYEMRRPVGRLAAATDPNRGAVCVTYAAGPASVPDDIFGAACQAVSLLWGQRSDGAPAASESWNGYSRSLSGPYTAAGVLETPTIASVLASYRATRVAVG